MMISVIIPTFNKLSRLKLTLASLCRQTLDRDNFEVIIINDGSTDGTKDYLDQYKADWRMKIINQSNQGRSAARNRGILAAAGDYLLFSDDDCLLSPDFIQRHYFNQLQHERIIHGRIITLSQMKFFDDPTQGTLINNAITSSYIIPNCISENDVINGFDTKIVPNRRMNNLEKCITNIFAQKCEDLYWIGFTGGNVSVPKEWILKVGMFSMDFGMEWGCEDLELGYKLFLKKYQFDYDYEAINYHIAHARLNFESEINNSFDKFSAMYHDVNIEILKNYLLGKINIIDLCKIDSNYLTEY